MPTLVLLLPDSPRLAPATEAATAAPAAAFEWRLVGDDAQLLGEGHDLPAALPKAEQLVLLLPEQAVSWHRVQLPRTSPKRWRAALVGLMEEQLLEDPEGLQFAVDEQASAGDAAWVAVTPKAPLVDALQRLEQGAQRLVDRIVPRSWPADVAHGHFFADAAGGVQLQWADIAGVASLPLSGGFARARFPASLVQGGDWTASAPALEAAERWLGTRVAVASEAERIRRALASPWNLRQFELAPRLHGLRWLRQLGHELMHRRWRSARRGVGLLLVLGVLGLNGLAWQQRQAIAERQQLLESTLKTAFPRIGYVLEPQLQMQRELNSLRAQTGELGEQDLEALIAALAVAWPEGRGPIEALSFEPGSLSLPASGWSDAQLEQLRRALASEQWQLVQEQGRLVVKRQSP